MHDDPDWFDDPEDAAAPRSGPRRTVVVAIATIPWVLVAALVLLPDRSGDAPVGASPPAPVAEARSAAETAAETNGPDPSPPVPPAGDRTDGDAEDAARPPVGGDIVTIPADIGTDLATRDSLAAVATVVARAWLTGVSPHLDVPGLTPTDPSSYAEHVVVEAIDRDDPHLAVVSLLAVLLRETPEGLRVDTRRVAVPLAITGGRAQPAGEPWWLPTPDLSLVDLPVEAQTDPAWFEAAATGLRAAGFEDVEVTALERTARWPWRAHITARTADGHPIDGPVWLRWTGQGFELAGHQPATGATTATEATSPRAAPDDPVEGGDGPIDDEDVQQEVDP